MANDDQYEGLGENPPWSLLYTAFLELHHEFVRETSENQRRLKELRSLFSGSRSMRVLATLLLQTKENSFQKKVVLRLIHRKLEAATSFRANEYAIANTDIFESGMSPIEHLLRHGLDQELSQKASFGRFSGRNLRYELEYIRESSLFDPDWMKLAYPEVDGITGDPGLFYLLLGSDFGFDPGPHFSSFGYFEINTDVFRQGVNPLFHFEKFGRKEARDIAPSKARLLAKNNSNELLVADAIASRRPTTQPNEGSRQDDWTKSSKSLATQLMREKKFEEAIKIWIQLTEAHPEDLSGGVYSSLASCYRKIGNISEASRSVEEGLAKFPKSQEIAVERAQIASAREDWADAFYLWSGLKSLGEEKKEHVALLRLLEAMAHKGQLTKGDAKRANSLVEGFSSRFLKSRGRALVALRFEDWPSARNEVSNIWREKSDSGRRAPRFSAPQLDSTPVPALAPTEKSHPSTDLKGRRVVVYTALYGNYDTLHTPLYRPEGVDFICFSDRTLPVPGWDFVILGDAPSDPILANRSVKAQPHVFLSKYDESIYIDANVLVSGDISLLLTQHLACERFAAWPHPERMDVIEELEAIVWTGRAPADSIVEQYQYFLEKINERSTGLIEASFLYRRARYPLLDQVMGEWWRLIQKFKFRDQPSIGYLMNKHKLWPRTISPKAGNSRKNDFFFRFEHLRGKETPASLSERWTPNSGPKRRSISWVREEKYASSGSSIMRGLQLSNLVSNECPELDVNYINEVEVEGVTDRLLVLTKGFLKTARPETLKKARDRGNIIFADFVDDPVRLDLVAEIDGLIASSIAQYIKLSENHPDRVVHYITHHVDPRLPTSTERLDRFSVGYFGEIANAFAHAEVSDIVSMHSVNTKNSLDDTSWLDKLNKYNAHYAVRNRRPIDGDKPFLKGFTAAHLGAVILTDKLESDARHYLTSDYPFYVQDRTKQGVREMIAFAEGVFGTQTWDDAIEIMRSVKSRSSEQWIKGEVRDLVTRLC